MLKKKTKFVVLRFCQIVSWGLNAVSLNFSTILETERFIGVFFSGGKREKSKNSMEEEQ